MKTKIIDTSIARDVKQFISFPYHLYSGDRYWIPPAPGEVELSMNREKHPFYTHSDADFIVVESENQTLGRIAVLKNNNYCNFHQVNTGFFFYFESVEDQQVAEQLLAAAEEWCRKRNIPELYGPRGFLRSDCIGLLVDGFEKEMATGLTYNKPYYQHQLESNGYLKISDHYSGFFNQHIDKRIHQVAKKVLDKGNFSVLNFHSMSEIKPYFSKLDELHHRSFAQNPGFYPSTSAEFELFADTILTLTEPKYIRIIMHDEEIAGFLVASPNITKGLKIARGKLLPFGWLALLLSKKMTNIIDIQIIGLLPEYQGLGGNAVLYSQIDHVLEGSRIKSGETGQIDERNFRSKSDMETMNVHWNKCHRTYKKTL